MARSAATAAAWPASAGCSTTNGAGRPGTIEAMRARFHDPHDSGGATASRRSDVHAPHPLPSVSSALVRAHAWLRSSFAESRAVLGAWRRRYRYRRELARLIRTGPHLIEDI